MNREKRETHEKVLFPKEREAVQSTSGTEPNIKCTEAGN